MGAGKWLIVAGIAIAMIGVWFTFSPRLPFLGKLPGDILIKREGFTFYFPLVTCLLLSLLLSLVMYLVKKFG